MQREIIDTIQNIEKLLEFHTSIETKKLLHDISKEFIGDEHHPLYADKYIRCVSSGDLKISHRFVLYYDLVKKLNIKPTNIINILPYFWFKQYKPTDIFTFTKIFKFYLCKKIDNYNILIDDTNPDAYNSKKLAKIVLDNRYDLIHAELFKDKRIYKDFYVIDDYLISVCKFIENNLNKGGTLFLHFYSFDKKIMTIIKNLIKNNIFISYDLFNYDFVSIFNLHSYDFYIQLNNYTCKPIDYDLIIKTINIDDIQEIVDNFYMSLYDRLTYYYSILLNFTKKEQVIDFIKNNILDYCNTLGLKIESSEIIKEKNILFKSININNSQILLISKNINNTFSNFMSEYKNLKIDYHINKKKVYSCIYLENEFNEIEEIFTHFINHWIILDNNGIIIIDNNNNNINNFTFTIKNITMLLNKKIFFYDSKYYTILRKLN